jgi:hypothetical protein
MAHTSVYEEYVDPPLLINTDLSPEAAALTS